MITVVISMRYEWGPDWTLRFPETNTFDCNKDPILKCILIIWYYFDNVFFFIMICIALYGIEPQQYIVLSTIIIMTRLRM